MCSKLKQSGAFAALFFCSSTDQVKVNSAYEPSGPDQDGAYPGFFNMKRLGVLLLPPGWDASLYSCSKVEALRVKCLDQEYNTMSWPGIKPRLLVYTAVARLRH